MLMVLEEEYNACSQLRFDGCSGFSVITGMPDSVHVAHLTSSVIPNSNLLNLVRSTEAVE